MTAQTPAPDSSLREDILSAVRPAIRHNDVVSYQKALDEIMRLIAQHDRQLLQRVEATLPAYEGGAALGRNYYTGYARGNNDVLDRVKAILKNEKERL